MESGSGKMGQWLIKKGIAKDDASAQRILIIFIIVCFVGTMYFINK
ncbi:MAG: hypothetical protein WC229_03755 [Candidatus Paceibacterota bacterium]|jgi:hypothetical protein